MDHVSFSLCYHLPTSGSVPSFLSPLQFVMNRTLGCVKAVGVTWDLTCSWILNINWIVFSPSLWTSKFFSVSPLFLLRSFLFGSVDELQSIMHDRQHGLHWAMPRAPLSYASNPWPFLLSGLCSHWTILLIPPDALPWFMTAGLCPLF